MSEEGGEEERVCRFCFAGEEANGDALLSPCRCSGSGRYVHRRCLSRWRATQRLAAASRHRAGGDDVRRAGDRCGVCGSEYDAPPLSPRTLLTHVGLRHGAALGAALEPGAVLLSTSLETRVPADCPEWLACLVRVKHAHFVRSVYLLTGVEPNGGRDGSDALLGVNLSRRLTDDGDDDEDRDDNREDRARALEAAGARRFLGGPVAPLRPVVLHTCGGVAGAEEVPLDGGACYVGGDIDELLAAAGGSAAGRVMVHYGHARWSRVQLMNEIARGDWGVLAATKADVDAALARPEALFEELRASGRALLPAPEDGEE